MAHLNIDISDTKDQQKIHMSSKTYRHAVLTLYKSKRNIRYLNWTTLDTARNRDIRHSKALRNNLFNIPTHRNERSEKIIDWQSRWLQITNLPKSCFIGGSEGKGTYLKKGRKLGYQPLTICFPQKEMCFSEAMIHFVVFSFRRCIWERKCWTSKCSAHLQWMFIVK